MEIRNNGNGIEIGCHRLRSHQFNWFSVVTVLSIANAHHFAVGNYSGPITAIICLPGRLFDVAVAFAYLFSRHIEGRKAAEPLALLDYVVDHGCWFFSAFSSRIYKSI
jgi:hypothetical protein